MKRTLFIYAALLSFLISGCKSDAEWQNLIGRDLGNWEQLNGTAPFELNNGEITGTTVPGSPRLLSLHQGKIRGFYT